MKKVIKKGYEERVTGLVAGTIIDTEEYNRLFEEHERPALNNYDGTGVRVRIEKTMSVGTATLRKGEVYHAVKIIDGNWLICTGKSRSTSICTLDVEEYMSKGFMTNARKTSEAQIKATAKYNREKTKAVTVRFTPGNMDVYEHLSKQENKTAYIAELIRRDMSN